MSRAESPTSPSRFPGIPTVADGGEAAVWVERQVSQAACAYPITPSTNMGVLYAEAVANGAVNLWGERIAFLEPESEHSSASAAEGFAVAGGRVVNFTSGQGLVLMKEVLFPIAGKGLPCVFHVGARALSSQALSIHCGHDDVMAVTDTGWGVLFAKNAQDVADLALIARRVAEATATPFFVVQDGFFTTHTLESIRLPEPELMREFVGSPERVASLFDPRRPLQSGGVQNQEAYMPGRIGQRVFAERVRPELVLAMREYGALTGRRVGLVEEHRMEDATLAIVALGSMAETAMATVDWLRRERGIACGVVHPTSLRPFPAAELVCSLARCRAVAVLERVDQPLAESNPLAVELKAAFADAISGHPEMPRIEAIPEIHSGSAGLGGRDVRPGDLVAVLDHLASSGTRRTFVLGVRHPLALDHAADPDVRPSGAFSLRGHSIGGYGSVTANKMIAHVVGEAFGLSVQAYPRYGSEKKGLPTTYYLTAAPTPIRAHCEIDHVDFVPIASARAFAMENPLRGLRDDGILFVQSTKREHEEVWAEIPPHARRIIRARRLRVLHLDAAAIAAETSSRVDLRVRMQGVVLLGVFLRILPRLSEIELESEEVFARIEPVIRAEIGEASEATVAENLACVRRGFLEVREIPRAIIYRDIERDSLVLTGRRVGDLMSVGVVTCPPEEPLGAVVARMRERDVSAVVVLDGEGAIAGVLSSSDLQRAHLEAIDLEPGLPDLRPAQLMTSEVFTTWPDESLEAAVDRLLERRVHRLVVVDRPGGRRPIGILSMTDVVRASSGAQA